MANIGKERIERYAVAGLIVVAAVIAGVRFLPRQAKGPTAQPGPGFVEASLDIPKLPEGMESVSVAALRGRPAYSPPPRDLFVPAGYVRGAVETSVKDDPAPPPGPPPLPPPPPPRPPVLTGIMRGSGKTLAILDGKVASAGDTCGGYLVAEIHSAAVVLLHGTNTVVLRRAHE